MAHDLGVDPVDLRMSADHMDFHHGELRDAHAAADGIVEGAQSGWMGASAAALHVKLAQWQATTTRLCSDIADHGQSFSTAADAYESADTTGAENISRSF